MKHIVSTLAFYVSLGQNWHTFNAKHQPTVDAIKSLEARGYLIVSRETSQAKWTGKTVNEII